MFKYLQVTDKLLLEKIKQLIYMPFLKLKKIESLIILSESMQQSNLAGQSVLSAVNTVSEYMIIISGQTVPKFDEEPRN